MQEKEEQQNRDQDQDKNSNAVSQIISKRQFAKIGGIGIGLIVLLIIVAVMFEGGSAPKEQLPSAVAVDNQMVFQKNANRLHDELKRSNTPVVLGKESEDMKARRNAPTVMIINSTLESENNSPAAINNTKEVKKASRITAENIASPDSIIPEGEFIHANLETAINSDLPGSVRAVITEPVYSLIGRHALIPAGSRLIGEYASASGNGLASTRVFVMWNRIITPEGVSILINSPASDNLGRAGMGADAVETHFWTMVSSSALLSILGYEASTQGVSSYDQPNSADQYRSMIGDNFHQSAQAALQGSTSIKPTLHVHQGDTVIVFVAHDVDMSLA